MKTQLNDKEFLRYISKELHDTFFGERNEIDFKWLSGVLLNYAFIGGAKSLKLNGCFMNIDVMSNPVQRLYWGARCNERRVVGLTYTTNHEIWCVPDEWILPTMENKPIYLNHREVILKNKEYYDVKNNYCYLIQIDDDYENFAPFLCSLYEVIRPELQVGNKLGLLYLFLFYPSLLDEFCMQLSNWAGDGISPKDKYKYLSFGVAPLVIYTDLIEGLSPLTQKNMEIREICNILNAHHLRGLANKIEEGLKIEELQNIFIECLKKNIRSGILNIHSIEDMSLNIDYSIIEGRELEEQLNKLKDKVKKIREL